MATDTMRKKLQNAVLENSVEKQDWKKATMEWDVVKFRKQNDTTCVCGKKNICNCFTIRNKKTGAILFPIGSECIEKFERQDLNEQMKHYEVMYILKTAFQQYTPYAEIKSMLNHRDFIGYLYENDIFRDDTEYEFFKKMLNKRKDISEKQEKWMKSIIYYKVKPFILKKMA